MSYDAIGRRYARAIFELGKEEGRASAIADQIASFAETYDSSEELKIILENPLVDEAARLAIVGDIAARVGATGTADRALRLVTKQRRLRALPDIARHLRRQVDEDAKVVRAHVTTASAPSGGYLDRLKAQIEQSTGQKVVLTHTVDPSIIGGVITSIGDRVVDGSIRSRLLSFRDAARPSV
ncbi:MAG: ATP synthase F1 subunit delta [Polyangiaceae bacterium]|nr:ATP synthase F1 subunit delta [Polyangiaceae bacterium]